MGLPRLQKVDQRRVWTAWLTLAIYLAAAVAAPAATFICALNPAHTLIVLREGGHIDYVLIHASAKAHPESGAGGGVERPGEDEDSHRHADHVTHTPEIGTTSRLSFNKLILPPVCDNAQIGFLGCRELDLNHSEHPRRLHTSSTPPVATSVACVRATVLQV